MPPSWELGFDTEKAGLIQNSTKLQPQRAQERQIQLPTRGKHSVWWPRSLSREGTAFNGWQGFVHTRSFRLVAVLLGIAIVGLVNFNHPHWLQSCHRVTRPAPRDVAASDAQNTALLEVFQVYPPVLTANPKGGYELTDGLYSHKVKLVNAGLPPCFEELIVHSFGNSYGNPAVGQYRPPSCSFNRVTWNLTVVSAGRQYDRLGEWFYRSEIGRKMNR
jgi:hypothetical protein